jgi:cytochrome c55X
MKPVIWLALSIASISQISANELISGSRQQELTNILIQDCGSCHGLRMKGGLGPPLRARHLQGKSADYLSQVIQNGRPGSAMPAWRSLLTPTESYWMAERLLREDYR